MRLRKGARFPKTLKPWQVGVPGTVSAIFSTVRDAAANVIMISQASSEHSVCFAVKQAQGEQAAAALNARCAAWELLANAGALGQDDARLLDRSCSASSVSVAPMLCARRA